MKYSQSVTCLGVRQNAINIHVSVHKCEYKSSSHSLSSVFSFCHLPTLIADIFLQVGLFICASARSCICIQASCSYSPQCSTSEPGSDLRKCVSLSDHQRTGHNYVHSCKRSVTPRGLNSLESCFHLVITDWLCVCPYLCVNVTADNRFDPKLQLPTCCGLKNMEQSSVHNWNIVQP